MAVASCATYRGYLKDNSAANFEVNDLAGHQLGAIQVIILRARRWGHEK